MNMNAIIKITDIDYEETFRNLYPHLLKQIGKKEKMELLYQLLEKMGDDALTFVSGFLEGFSGKEKNRLFALAVNSNAEELTKQISKKLEENELGKAFELERISVRHKGEELVLFLENIQVDVKELMKSDVIREKMEESGKKKLGSLIGGIGHIFSKQVDKMAFSFITSEKNKQKIVDMAQHVMDRRGIVLTLSDIYLEKRIDSVDGMETGAEEAPADVTEFMQGGGEEFAGLEPAETEISDEMMEFLLNAAAGYLRTLLHH